MSVLNLVIKKPDGQIVSNTIESVSLSKIITNVKLYEKDLTFINMHPEAVVKSNTSIIPIDDGIIVIDMVQDIIFDSQGFTAVNKLTPAEIKMSKRGNTPGETTKDSVVLRFKELFEADKLKYFEEWHNNGITHNTKVLDLSFSELMKTTFETNVYGQFVFDTKPFKVIQYSETDQREQHNLFHNLVKYGFVNENDSNWKKYLETFE